MTDRQEEVAALHALHMLEDEEARTFAGEMKYAPRTVAFVQELEDVVGELGGLVAPHAPPDQMRARILSAIKAQPSRKTSGASSASSSGALLTAARIFLGAGGWAAAAGLALFASGLWYRQHKAVHDLDGLKQTQSNAGSDVASLRDAKTKLEQQLAESQKQADALKQEVSTLKHDVSTLKQTNPLASLEVASLWAQNKLWTDSVALVLWDNAKQEGVLRLSKMPPATHGHDYQFWVVDDGKPPVSAGLVKVNDKGEAAVGFKPVTNIASAGKFAISVEKQGGSAKNEGPIVLLGP